MGRNDRRRQRLLDRKVFENYGDWDYGYCFVSIMIFILRLCGVMIFILLPELIWYGAIAPNGIYAHTVIRTLYFIMFYAFGIVITIGITCLKVPDKYFRLCSLLAIFHLLLIIFLVVHPFQTFVPGPETKILEEQFEISILAKFIWIPCLIVPIFLCSIVTWKASDQSELYTVILDGKRSSTKIIDV